MKLRSVLVWLAASLILAAALFAQRQLVLDAAGEQLHTAARLQAQALARQLAVQIVQAADETGTEIDEFLVRPLVFELMETSDVLACSVQGPDRLLEAQMRQQDGTLAPMEGMDLPLTDTIARVETAAALQVTVMLDDASWKIRVQQLADTSLWKSAVLALAGAAALFVACLLLSASRRTSSRAGE